MADVKVEKGTSQASGRRQEQGMERHGGAGLARRGEWWPHDMFATNPFSMMRRLSEEMDRAFGTSFGLSQGEDFGNWAPAIEVKEKDNNLIVCADLPGMNKDNIKVECTGDAIVIEGERKREQDETRSGVHRSERSYGHFYRMIPLPEGADAEKANAQFKDGVLEVKVPLGEGRRRREIPIQT